MVARLAGTVRGVVVTEPLKSRQLHTIPRWFLENFTDRDGMLHVALAEPRRQFKSGPRKVFRRRDYYAAKAVGASLEDQVTGMESLFLPSVRNVVRAARRGIDDGDFQGMEGLGEDIGMCGLFALHLRYRSPRWMGDDYLAGMDALRIALEREGKDMQTAIGDESLRLWRQGDFVLVLSEVAAPTFVIGDCGPFVAGDSQLGVDNAERRRDDPNWVPADQRMWMALCPGVALGVAMRETGAMLVNVMPDTSQSADWVDHFNELCARRSGMIAGASGTPVRTASQQAWPTE